MEYFETQLFCQEFTGNIGLRIWEDGEVSISSADDEVLVITNVAALDRVVDRLRLAHGFMSVVKNAGTEDAGA